MARLSSAQLKQIHSALLDAYSSSDELAQMARLELGENLDTIARGKNLSDQVFALVIWAERTNRVHDLIHGALASNPRNLALHELLQLVSDALPQFRSDPLSNAGKASLLHDVPFIGPVPFNSDTADLFFGRDEDVERLANRLLTRSVPLIIVNGLSGSGKTSLLRAGLMPLLKKRGVLAVYASILDSPHSDLLHALKRSAAFEGDAFQADSIQLLNQLRGEAVDGWMVLIVDQLERCFNNPSISQDQISFWRDIARILRGDTVQPVKLILCVRSDWLHAFQTVSPSPVDIPVFNYLFLVERLTLLQAREALVSPLQKFHISAELAVVDEIVDDLSTAEGFVHPPQLQVVGSTLYEYLVSRHAGSEEMRLTRQDYQEMHGASSILRQHLVKILSSLGPLESVGWQILLRLVGDDDIRISRHENELRGSFNEEVFQPVIKCLVEYSLVVRDVSKVDGRHVYTLTHDYLIGEIKSRFQYDHRLQALRTSEHYLESGLADYRRSVVHETNFLPLEYERYSHIWRHREDLEWMNPDATEYLALSALWHGDSSFAVWFSRLPTQNQQQAEEKIQEICLQQVSRGDNRPAQAIELAAKHGLPPETAGHLALAMQNAFAVTGTVVENSVARPANSGAAHAQEVFAGVLWSMRRTLPPGKLVPILPALTQHWLRRNRTALLSTAVGVMLFAALLFITWYVQEQLAGTWISISPLRAGIVTSFVAAPGVEPAYFAATNRGRFVGEASTVFTGDLADRQWSALGASLVNEPIQSLAAAKQANNISIFASVRGRGVYRWQSESEIWSMVNRGLHSYDIVDLAVDPDNPLVIYAAAINYSGVFESSDGGESWHDTSGNSLFGVSITTLTFSGEGPGWVLAGSADGRIFRKQRSADITSEWQPVAAFPGSGGITALTWESVGGLTLLAGTATGKVYISIDGGGTWVFLSQLPNIFSITSIAIMPGEPDKVFLVAYGVGGYTIWHSIDEVYSWALVEDTSFSREFIRLVAGPPGSDQLFAFGAPGLFVTENEGRSWHWVGNLDAPLGAVTQVYISSVQGGPTFIQLEGSVYTTHDLLNPKWERSNGLPALAVRDLALDPVDPNTAYVGIYVPNRWSFYITENGGDTWQATAKPDAIAERFVDDTTAVAVGVQHDQSIIYLGTASCGVIHSEDRGHTWETFGRTDCNIQDGPYAVSDIVIAPDSLNTVYVAADNGFVYRSTDRGRTWRAGQLPIAGRINRLAADQQVADRLYAIARGDGFWRSDDGGATWRKLSSGLEQRALISLVTARNSSALYVAATNGDVWVSSNGGEYWQNIRRNLPGNIATSIALTANDETLVLATVDQGLYFLHKGFLPPGAIK